MDESDHFKLSQAVERAKAKLGIAGSMIAEVASVCSQAHELGRPVDLLGDAAVSDFRKAVERLDRQLGVGA
jgi:hypothetical protein